MSSVVVIGVFDGVHKGHQIILDRAKEIADGRKIVALTFDPHPTTVFAPDRAPTLLTTLADRVVLLKIHGADQVAVMKFDEKFAALSPEDFVNQILIKQLDAGDVIVGENFTYGHKAAGNVQTLKAHSEFKVHVLALHSDDTEPVSSTRIRAAITKGDVETARLLLSRPHRLDGVVVHGEARGREIGYPTANLGHLEGQSIPADGIYAGWLTVGINRWSAAISIGTNPTFAGVRSRQVEAYAIDQIGLELYDQDATVEFGWHLRETLKFDGLEPLLEQMKRDCDLARKLTEA
jgi:riboflavin kinase/FMN adenylyltransferase